MQIKILRVFFAIGVIFLLLVLGDGQSVSAGQAAGWVPDEKVPGYLDDTLPPFLLADQNRTVHAFASQRASDLNGRTVIVYRRWTLMGGWTRPVDVILAPDGDADLLGAFLDKSDMVHVIFSSGKSSSPSVYYSTAPVSSADWAPAWSAPIILGYDASSVKSAAITGDDLGNLVVIYSGTTDGEGVYFVGSSDYGKSWSKPDPIFLTHDSMLVAYSIRIFMGANQQARAAWNVVTGLGVDETLYFANYDTPEGKWSIPINLDNRIDKPDYFGPAIPAIVDNGKQLVILYNGGNPVANRPVDIGRPVQRVLVSDTGGVTWNEPTEPFPFHVGKSGENAIVLDGGGTPHIVFIQRTESADEDGKYIEIGGIWHSAFQNGIWSNPDRLVTSIAPYDVRAVVSQGNVLLAVWREDPGAGNQGVWYSYSILDAPELPAIPWPTDTSNIVLAPQATSSVVLQSTPTMLPENILSNDSPPPVLGTNPAGPIFASAILVILILIGIIVGYSMYTNRNI